MIYQKLNALIVDDELELRKSVKSVIQSSLPGVSFNIQEADNGKVALDMLKEQSFDIILMDVRMPEMDGLEALEQIQKIDSRIFVVIFTAHSNLQDAVKAIKYGAYDYLEKPLQPSKLTEILSKVIDTRDIVQELALANPIFDDDVDSELVGRSEKMRGVYDLIHRLSHVDTTVLIRGENGTGKELVARAIHSNSPRKHGEFIAINCGAIPENLMESEIFGHEKGAFTGAVARSIGKFQLANDGTIFLDEIGELKPELQVKLLRVLQERKFIPVGGHREIKTNARVIAATNRNLEMMIEQGQFREDLFYRLNVMPIFLPPLRDRVDDIEDLARFFVKRFNQKLNKSIKGMDPAVNGYLKNYHWPGNIRELENAIERAFIIEMTDQITTHSLPDNIKSQKDTHISLKQTGEYSGPLDFDKFKEESEREFIVKALQTNKGKINKTVAHANIPKNTLLRKIKKYGINVKEFSE